MSNSPTNLSDYEAISNTVQHYIDGAKSGRGAEMKLAFHDDPTIFGHSGANLMAGPIQTLFDAVDGNPRGLGTTVPDRQYRRHRHRRHCEAGARQLVWQAVHRHVHAAQSRRRVEDYEQGLPSALLISNWEGMSGDLPQRRPSCSNNGGHRARCLSYKRGGKSWSVPSIPMK